jgi:hypothetical protein
MTWIDSLEPSDWIDVLGIFVNAGLAFWIVKTIQNRLTNKRVLKDHFINEVKELRNEYKACLSNLYSDQTQPKRVVPWFKLMNIKVNDLMAIVAKKYKIDKTVLHPYQRELQELITNNEEFIDQFKSAKPIVFTENSKNTFIKFQQEHSHIFNELIIHINDAN